MEKYRYQAHEDIKGLDVGESPHTGKYVGLIYSILEGGDMSFLGWDERLKI